LLKKPDDGKTAYCTGLAVVPVQEVQTLRGKLFWARCNWPAVDFAMIDNGLGFSPIPWWPVLENKVGRKVMGTMRGEDISWQFSRVRTLGIGI
jgi:Protein of unknown function (DUF3363)